jgi:predicted dienelactone hydrolase
VDVARTETGKPAPLYDRPLKAEIWYPAKRESDLPFCSEYENVMTRDGKTIVSLWGQAARDAEPAKEAGPCPLVILSHGYPGNRFIMCHFGENLASKGYVVVSMDHFESTYDNLGAFSSTLYNRPLDQLFILNAMARLNGEDTEESAGMGMGMGMGAGADANLAGMIDADRTAIIGYSMGGYGLINTIGGGFRPAIAKDPMTPPNMLLAMRQAGNPQYEASLDSRIKAAVAIAPWGWTYGFWDKSGLEGVRTPLLFLAGGVDTTVGYEPGVRNIFESCVHAERYLLTFENAGHNAIAPIPAPREVCLSPGPEAKYWKHYQDPVWDGVRSNNIAQHFVTAFLAKYLMGDPAAEAYLDLPERSEESTATGNTSWKGFSVRNASGLRFECLRPPKIR